MTTRAGHTQPCGKQDARTRLEHARAFADTAELALDVEDDASLNVSASLAVLSGVAAVGAEMSRDLARLLDLKDNAHYGAFYLSETKARQAVKWAQRMVAAAGTAVLG